MIGSEFLLSMMRSSVAYVDRAAVTGRMIDKLLQALALSGCVIFQALRTTLTRITSSK
jgi:hypothetical protein